MMKNKKIINDFTQGNITTQLIQFTMPLLLSNLLQTVYNMVDMMIVGQVMGKTGLSAVAVGGDVIHFLTFVAMGFSGAGQVILSLLLGAEKKEKIGRLIGTICIFLLTVSIGISVVCMIFRHEILWLMHTPSEAYEQALRYSTVCIMGLVFIYGYNMMSAILRGLGDSRHPFIFISIAVVLNIVLDFVLVLGLSMGAAGAALATVISQGVSFVLCVIFLIRHRIQLGFTVRKTDFLHLDREMMGELMGLGIPMAIKSASVQFSKVFVNSWINSYGVDVSAFAGIMSKINSTSILVASALSTAGSSLIGQNIGAQNSGRVKQIIKRIYLLGLMGEGMLVMLILGFPVRIFSLFTSEESVLTIGLKALPIIFLSFVGAALRPPNTALINGSGNHRMNFITALLDGIVFRVGLALLFGLKFHMNYYGFWLGDALAGFTPFFIGTWYLLRGDWMNTAIKRERTGKST